MNRTTSWQCESALDPTEADSGLKGKTKLHVILLVSLGLELNVSPYAQKLCQPNAASLSFRQSQNKAPTQLQPPVLQFDSHK